MAEQMRPASPSQAPDPANSYERAHPEREAGMGRMDNNDATPASNPDQQHQAVTHQQESRQINAHEVTSARQGDDPNNPDRGGEEPDHSMHDEEPLDEGPTENVDPRFRRHPRTEGKGGTP